MPELPEVETTKNGLNDLIANQTIDSIHIFHPTLRWKIPTHLIKTLKNKNITSIKRQAKYLLIKVDVGELIIHLGMSGSLSVVSQTSALEKHQHFVLNFTNGLSMRLKDPRRFGAVLWQNKDEIHPLLTNLGVEPLSNLFNTKYLQLAILGKKRPIKSLIMDSKIVVGVGNIYALESLFRAKISPLKPVNELSKKQITVLVLAIKDILKQAISQGGTTLKDFSNVDKKAGYFAQSLNVYGRENKQCISCCDKIVKALQSNRASYYCPTCQS